MRFMVARASQSVDGPPIPEAVRGEAYWTECRPVGTYDPSSWLWRGRNHRVENGFEYRDIIEPAWFVELPDLAALLEIIDREGKVVIHPPNERTDEDGIPLHWLTIYDDYIE